MDAPTKALILKMATAVSMITEHVLKACCGIEGSPLFGKDKPTSGSTTATAESKVDPKFKRTFLNQQMKFELTEWKKLPPKARKAAQDLGYTKETWDNSETVDVSWKSWWDLTAPEKAALEVLGWEETAWEYQYQWTEWKDLPELQKKAAKIAGYDKDSWEEGWVEGLDVWWEELGKKEKEAVCVLGWTQQKWDDE